MDLSSDALGNISTPLSRTHDKRYKRINSLRLNLLSPVVSRAILFLMILLVWEIGAVLSIGLHLIPSPLSVANNIYGNHFYLDAIGITGWEALRGWIAGNVLAVIIALLCIVLPVLERPARVVATVSYATPVVAVAPFLIILMNPDLVKVTMAAVSVFFVTLTVTLSGLKSAPATAIELIEGLGGSSKMVIAKIRIPSGLRGLANSLALSAPAAILGAILGEYLGGNNGLGVQLLSAQQLLNIPRTWGVAIIITVLSSLLFLFFRKLAHSVAKDFGMSTGTVNVSPHKRSLIRDIGSPIITALAVIAVWEAAVLFLPIDPYFAKSPLDLWRFLVTTPGASANLGILSRGLLGTLRDTFFGWLGGSVAALLFAILLALVPSLGTVVMPVVLTLRSIPLVAMVPVFTLLFGHGLLGAALIAATITFVPSIVLLTEGLRSTPVAANELMRGLGASAIMTLIKVRLPLSLPSVLEAAKISIPGALLGAVVAEWLATSNGLGHLISLSISTSNYQMLWGSVATIALVSLISMEIFGALENRVAV